MRSKNNSENTAEFVRCYYYLVENYGSSFAAKRNKVAEVVASGYNLLIFVQWWNIEYKEAYLMTWQIKIVIGQYKLNYISERNHDIYLACRVAWVRSKNNSKTLILDVFLDEIKI